MFHLRSKVIQVVDGVSIHMTPHFHFAQYILVQASARLFIILQTFFGQRPLIGSGVHNACVPVCVSLFMFDVFFCLCVLFLPLCVYEYINQLASSHSIPWTQLNAADKTVCAAISDQLEGRDLRCISSVSMH